MKNYLLIDTNMSELRKKIIEVVKQKTSKDEVLESHRLIEDLGLDSLDNVELIMELECNFNVTISDDDAQKMKTIDDVCSYVECQCKVDA